MTSIRTIQQAFKADWQFFWGDRKPLAHELRRDGSLPWVRFHALPGSKRYAENEREMAIILDRAYALGDTLLGNGRECWQIECLYDDKNEVLDHGAAAKFVLQDTPWLAKASKTLWHRNEHDELLMKIAEDVAGPTIWMRCADGIIFSPYDGGFDLFPSDQQTVENLKDTFSDWLSSHPYGL